jgi:hypothetical protein
MAPGIIEEGGQTVRTFITSLKDHPAILVLALCNLALIVFLYFALSKAAEFRTELVRESFNFQHKAAELLARCVLTDEGKRSELSPQTVEQITKQIKISPH